VAHLHLQCLQPVAQPRWNTGSPFNVLCGGAGAAWCDVFISHAGEDKHGVVSFIKEAFTSQYPHLRVFVDWKMRAGDGAWEEIKEVLENAKAGTLPFIGVVIGQRLVHSIQFTFKHQDAAECSSGNLCRCCPSVTYAEGCASTLLTYHLVFVLCCGLKYGTLIGGWNVILIIVCRARYIGVVLRSCGAARGRHITEYLCVMLQWCSCFRPTSCGRSTRCWS
jgi:hypothetical protein